MFSFQDANIVINNLYHTFLPQENQTDGRFGERRGGILITINPKSVLRHSQLLSAFATILSLNDITSQQQLTNIIIFTY